MRRLLAVALCLTIAPPLVAQAPRRAPDFSEVQRILQDGLAKEKATAAAVAVVRNDAIIWEEAFGWADSANGRRATPNSPFQLASLNKTIEATLAAILAHQRRVDLDTPVNDYLRTTSVSSPAWDVRGVTLRGLLMHTAGVSTFDLGCDTAFPASACHFPSADETIHDYGVIARQPGSEFDYSNIGYFIATEALARAAGRPARDLMRDEVFRPLGILHSSFGLDSAEERLAVVPDAFAFGLVHDPVGAPTTYRTARGYSSAHDLALFAAFHMKSHGSGCPALFTSTTTATRSDGMLDQSVTGRWTGAVYAAGGRVPVTFEIDSTGRLRATIGTRTDSGTARRGEQLVIRVPGDLEAANPPGMQRQISLYLKPYKDGWGGVATVRPPAATGTDGRVSYWVELTRP